MLHYLANWDIVAERSPRIPQPKFPRSLSPAFSVVANRKAPLFSSPGSVPLNLRSVTVRQRSRCRSALSSLGT